MAVADVLKTYRSLRPAIDIDGPRVRAAIAWGIVAFVATSFGALHAAVVFAAVAVGASGQACAAWRRRRRLPYRPVAVGGAVLIALAAASGPLAVVAAAVVAGVASMVAGSARLGGRVHDARLTAAIALVVGVAAAPVPLARTELGASAALVLLMTVLSAEASAFLVGAGSRTRFDGAVAAIAAIAAVSVAAAAVLVPPFRGSSPWILGAVTALLFPLGPRLATALLPRPRARVPALRRLDGFAVVGPVWVLVAALVLDVS